MLGLLDLLELLEFPNVNYSLLFSKNAPPRLLKYLALKFRQISQKLQADSPDELKHLLQIVTLSSSLLSIKEQNPETIDYLVQLSRHFA